MIWSYQEFQEILFNLKGWQTLVGVLIGTILTLITSFIKDYIDSLRERRESRRRVEIYITKTLNDLITARNSFNLLIKNIEGLIEELKSDTKENAYFLGTVTAPKLEISFYDELCHSVTKSYYIHNKILWSSSAIKFLNTNLVGLGEHLNDISNTRNKFLITSGASKDEQKGTYLENLENILKNIKEIKVQGFDGGIKNFLQIKIYNQKLRSKIGFYNSWKFEGASFKYFKTYKDILAFNQEPPCINRIDDLIESDVEAALAQNGIK